MNPNEIKEEIEHTDKTGTNKKTFFSKIKDMAIKTKYHLKAFFPRRIKGTAQENHKGEKF